MTEVSPVEPSMSSADIATRKRGPIRRFFTHPWFLPVLIVVSFAGAAAAVLLTNPTNNVGPSTCAFKLMTGFDCPGCGGTRAFYYALTFNIPEAARNHAMAVFAAPFMTWLFAQWSIPRMFPTVRWRLPYFIVTPRAMIWFVSIWGVYWVVRNLPWEPFTYLYV